MCRRLGIDVTKRQADVILMDDVRRDLAFDYPLEDCHDGSSVGGLPQEGVGTCPTLTNANMELNIARLSSNFPTQIPFPRLTFGGTVGPTRL